MRFVLGLLSGILGMLAGWFGLALAVIGLSGHDQDGGIAMGAFFGIGPIGGIAGFVVGVWAFTRFGIRRSPTSSGEATDAADTATPVTSRVSRPVAIALLVVAGLLAWATWYEFVRSPYLSHGFMTLDLQFRLPPGTPLPGEGRSVDIVVEEAGRSAIVTVPERWSGHDGDRAVILATASLMLKTGRRAVRLTLPGIGERVWSLDLASDPDPTPGFSPWRPALDPSPPRIEMNYRLSAER